ncbi:unnamed protein product [Adineta ricciae]|uniref:Uncharacterized protein n=1 Tax=Adineta ricciae TaxID=249248 RepID=A0A813N8F5_ADIRI|nr:unnamed protein product [Adineta ricciae]CAF0944773.1 unnamed protein product [Adineta ricciae]
MPNRAESSATWNSQSIASEQSNGQDLPVTCCAWLLRFVLCICLLLFSMPLALLLAPWWVWLQVLESKLPYLINGYYRIVTWPLTLSQNIRSYRQDDYFIEKLKW